MAENLYPLTRPLLIALRAAKDAGLAVLEVYKQDFDVRYKEDRSPLTIADQRSHKIIVDQLTEPGVEGFPILSEEGKDIPFEKRRAWKYFWLLDPLDGTKEFIKRNGEFTINIALIYQDRPILGVIYAPVNQCFYFASKDIGAYKLLYNDAIDRLYDEIAKRNADEVLKAILTQSDKLPHEDSRLNSSDSQLVIAGSRSHPSKDFEAFVEDMKKTYTKVDVVSSGSSLKLCLVAEGKADIYPRLGPTMEWDTAAGQAIVEQAGGSVINYETGEPLEYNKKDLLNPWFVVKLHKYI
ncbi:MAG: 3'(2'),5'-bisphosphate nucleotidase CysQ [Desulfobacterales bacterium]